MGEERKPVLNWLKLEEINDLLSGTELKAEARNMLGDNRKLLLEQIMRKVLDSESPISAIKAILEIPDGYEIGSGMVDLGEISIMILFARAEKHLSTDEIELVGKVLKRMYPDGNGLGDEPGKTTFFTNARKSLPDDMDAMVKEVEKAGIDKSEYIREALRPVLARILYGTDTEALARTLADHKNFLSHISDFYGVNNLDMEEKQRLFLAADILLNEYFVDKDFDIKATLSDCIAKAIEIYRWLWHNDMMEIGEDRQEIVEIYHRYEINRISKKKRDKEIRKLFTIE